MRQEANPDVVHVLCTFSEIRIHLPPEHLLHLLHRLHHCGLCGPPFGHLVADEAGEQLVLQHEHLRVEDAPFVEPIPFLHAAGERIEFTPRSNTGRLHTTELHGAVFGGSNIGSGEEMLSPAVRYRLSRTVSWRDGSTSKDPHRPSVPGARRWICVGVSRRQVNAGDLGCIPVGFRERAQTLSGVRVDSDPHAEPKPSFRHRNLPQRPVADHPWNRQAYGAPPCSHTCSVARRATREAVTAAAATVHAQAERRHLLNGRAIGFDGAAPVRCP